jgi:hypothetical protein
MPIEVMNTEYSHQDAAFALEHGNFGDFQRNLAKGEFLVLPRQTSPGPGSKYRYGHLVELSLHMYIGAAYGRETAKNVVWALFSRLVHNDTGLKRFNALERADQDAVRAAEQDFAEEKFRNFAWHVAVPNLVFHADIISRDLASPTFLIFSPHRVMGSHDVSLVDGSTTFKGGHEHLLKTLAGQGDRDYAEMIRSSLHTVGNINLTSILTRLDRLLGLRLRARGGLGA